MMKFKGLLLTLGLLLSEACVGRGEDIGQAVSPIIDEYDKLLSPSNAPDEAHGQPSVAVLPGLSGATLVQVYTDSGGWVRTTTPPHRGGSIVGWAYSATAGSNWVPQPTLYPPNPTSGEMLLGDARVSPDSGKNGMSGAVWLSMLGTNPQIADRLAVGRFVTAGCPAGVPVCPGNSAVAYTTPTGLQLDRPWMATDGANNIHVVFVEYKPDQSTFVDWHIRYLKLDPSFNLVVNQVLARASTADILHDFPQLPQIALASWGGIIVTWGEYAPSPVDGAPYHIYVVVGTPTSSSTVAWTPTTEVAGSGPAPSRISSGSDWINGRIAAVGISTAVPGGTFIRGPRDAPSYMPALTVNQYDNHCYLAYRTYVSSSQRSRIVVVSSADGLTWTYRGVLDTKTPNPGARGYYPTITSAGQWVVAAWYDDRDTPMGLQANSRWRVYASSFDVTTDTGTNPFNNAFPISNNSAVPSGSFLPTGAYGGSSQITHYWAPNIGSSQVSRVAQNWWGDHMTIVGNVGGFFNPFTSTWTAAPSQFYVSWTDSSRLTTSDSSQTAGYAADVRGTRVDVTP